MEASVFAGAFVVVIGGAFRYFTVTIVIYRGRPMRMVGFWGGRRKFIASFFAQCLVVYGFMCNLAARSLKL